MQPVQARMARAALGLSVQELADRAGIARADLAAFEGGEGAEPETLQVLSLHFSANGIELIDGDGVRAKSGQAAQAVTVDDLTTDNDGGEG